MKDLLEILGLISFIAIGLLLIGAALITPLLTMLALIKYIFG